VSALHIGAARAGRLTPPSGWAALAALALLATPAFAAEPPSILKGTIGEATHPAFAGAVADGAVALWAIGAIEAHGPHLPLATDVYVPQAQLGRVRQRLSRSGVRTVLLPPYYWGVNQVTGDFPGSIDVRPEVMVELMSDVFRSLGKAGIRRVYLVTGHYDAAHDRAIAEAVRRARREGWVQTSFVVPAGLADRIGLPDEPGILRVQVPPDPRVRQPDLHGGRRETSMMLEAAPGAVAGPRLRSLPPVSLSPEEVAAWRKGYAQARRLTPDGYLGAPAEASRAEGRRALRQEADLYAGAILRDLRPPP
jgi:creatinine amidohydrolase